MRENEIRQITAQLEGNRVSSRKNKRDLQKIWRDGGIDLSCCRRHYRGCCWDNNQRFESHGQTIGAKAASALPGLIGAIVSFLFKTAGQAIGYLAEHTWLLILAAVVFIFDKCIKKRS